jgi:hypothetical protein
MAEESASTFVITLVLLLVLGISKLPFSKPLTHRARIIVTSRLAVYLLGSKPRQTHDNYCFSI